MAMLTCWWRFQHITNHAAPQHYLQEVINQSSGYNKHGGGNHTNGNQMDHHRSPAFMK
ncbi:hypothetical protein HED22_08520 [Thalassospira sp. HF15]|uniref:hypothetical protein n=1 Tax=Thalassospira sp. HF15 TaxID=2722755 RepID=UPI001430F134|nr:hypothetical protein [Thalassospira sp. HF15]NIY75685.1 hypothetical protein [Thalassospira sp. HF15]